MRILYIGIFSGTNIGDLVVSSRIYNYLKEKCSLVDRMDFTNLRKINSEKNISVYGIDTIRYKVRKVLYRYDFIRIIHNRFLEICLNSEKHNIYKEYKKIVCEYDLICIGGGNLFMSILHNQWAIKLNKIIKIAKDSNKKIFIISVGAGPILLNKSRRLFRESLESVDHITVRDEYSAQVIKGDLEITKKIYVSGDPALLLDKSILRFDGNRNAINISISIMPFGKKGFPNLSYYKNQKFYINMYKDLIEYLFSKDNRYIFHLFSTEMTDYETILELYMYIINNSIYIRERNLKVDYINDLNDLLAFYNGQDLLIGTRMHSLIIGFTQSLPIIAISWQNKVESFMRQVDLLPYCYQLNSINMNLDNIFSNIQELLKHGQNNDNKIMHTKKLYDNINSPYLKFFKL